MSKAAELQRLKYAMLITKLEEMNRLHREVLNEEHQRQHLHDLEQLQAQHLAEFRARLDAAKADTAALHLEREAERTALLQQREQERVIVDRWSADKDSQLDSLRAHFLQRETLLLEAARAAEARAAELREQHARTQLADIEARDRERREWEVARADYARQVSQLLQEKQTMLDSSLRASSAAESAQRELAMLQEDNARHKARLSECSARLGLVDSLQSAVHRLQAEASQAAEQRTYRDRQVADQEAELAAKEARLTAMRAELEAREQARREARRQERRHIAELGPLDGPGGLHRFGPQDLDCAWASGPIDRKLLQAGGTRSSESGR